MARLQDILKLLHIQYFCIPLLLRVNWVLMGQDFNLTGRPINGRDIEQFVYLDNIVFANAIHELDNVQRIPCAKFSI